MTTEDLLRKLAPFLPERVRRWRRALAAAEPAVRTLIEHQVRVVADKELGDLDQPLFSLPPRRTAAGAFHLGTVVYNGDRWPAGLTPDELVQNLAVFGRSGAGKTNLCFHILKQLVERGVPFLFLDWKRTARHLLPDLDRPVRVYTPGRRLSPFPFNPFLAPPALEHDVYVNLVVDALADAYTLGDGARSLLQKVLTEAGGPLTPASVLDRLRAVPDTERVCGWNVSAIRALESLARVHTDTGASQDEMVRALTRESTVLELDSLAPSGKAFLIPVLCLWVYYTMLTGRARERLRFVIVVEEAHHVLFDHRGTRESLMQMLLRECRELGMGMIVIDQHPGKVSRVALGNTYASVCLNLKDPVPLSANIDETPSP